MTQQTTSLAGSGDRYDLIVATLKSYPDLTADELNSLKIYFKSASALDVASIVSDDDAGAKYTRFRAEHLDRLAMRDMIYVALGIAVLVIVVGAIGYLAP